MNRRQFLNKTKIITLMGLGGPLLKATQVQAQELPTEIQLLQEISDNHGHEVSLTPGEALRVLRQCLNEGAVELNIQGTSRHPHQLLVNGNQMLALFTKAEVQLLSSEDFGHSHNVTLKLLVP